MTLAVRKSGATKSVVKLSVHKAGTTHNVTSAFLRTGGALKTIFSSNAISLNTTFVQGIGNSAGSITVHTDEASATVTGGIGTIAYSWTRTDGGAHAWTIVSPTSDTTSFSTAVAANTEQDATFVCTATDQAGQVLTTGTVNASCFNNYFGGGGGPYP